MTTMRDQLRELLKPCLESIRSNILPGIILQIFAASLIFTYYYYPPVTESLNVLGDWKTYYGYTYSAIATSISGGLIPFIILVIYRKIPQGLFIANLLFYTIFWATKGIEADIVFRLQGHMFGYANDTQTIMTKVLIDQLIYCPTWVVPSMMISFLWKDSNFSMKKAINIFKTKQTFQRYLSILLSNWIVWIPAVAFVYSLPGPLQVPIFNIILVFWTLLLSYLSFHSQQSVEVKHQEIIYKKDC